MATVVPWPCRHQAALADTSAVKAPKPPTGGGRTAGTLGPEGGRDARAPGGTQPPNSVAPIARPAACGVRGCSTAAVAGAGRDEADWRWGLASSSIKQGSPGAAARPPAASPEEGRRGLPPSWTTAPVAAGGGVAGRGRRPTGSDPSLRHQVGSSPTTRPQPPRARLPNGHEAPPCGRIPRPAARPEESTAVPGSPPSALPGRGLRDFHGASPWKFHGNRHSKVYRVPGCKGYASIRPAPVVPFATEAEAQQAGYRKAKDCP
jgi:hypothetical protein